eukprot:1158214-Pelagomonas_calceolata.AAC.3
MGVPGPNFVSERALFLGNATFGPGRSIRPKIWPNQGHVKLFESFKNNVLRVQKEQEAPRRVFVKNGQTIGSASKVLGFKWSQWKSMIDPIFAWEERTLAPLPAI